MEVILQCFHDFLWLKKKKEEKKKGSTLELVLSVNLFWNVEYYFKCWDPF